MLVSLLWRCPIPVSTTPPSQGSPSHLHCALPSCLFLNTPSFLWGPLSTFMTHTHIYRHIQTSKAKNRTQRKSMLYLSFWIWVISIYELPDSSIFLKFSFLFLTAMHSHIFCIHLSVDGYLSWFYFLAIVNNFTVLCVSISVVGYRVLWVSPGMVQLAHMIVLLLVLQNPDFYNGWTSLYFHQQEIKALSPLHPHQNSPSFVFLMTALLKRMRYNRKFECEFPLWWRGLNILTSTHVLKAWLYHVLHLKMTEPLGNKTYGKMVVYVKGNIDLFIFFSPPLPPLLSVFCHYQVSKCVFSCTLSWDMASQFTSGPVTEQSDWNHEPR